MLFSNLTGLISLEAVTTFVAYKNTQIKASNGAGH
jgi:hypothetical protein